MNAIENIHKMGYIHNDIKPNNIMIDNLDGLVNGKFKILLIDYGIATKFV